MTDEKLDPKPGDVIRIDDEWVRTVVKRDGDKVEFVTDFDGDRLGPFTVPVEAWLNVLKAKAR